MAISTDYTSPIQVNGYSCRNCTDVAYAKKGIDPTHPKSGPYGINAATDPDRRTEAVSLGGRLAEMDLNACPAIPPSRPAGTQIDIYV